jgi:hypothetical protein
MSEPPGADCVVTDIRIWPPKSATLLHHGL